MPGNLEASQYYRTHVRMSSENPYPTTVFSVRHHQAGVKGAEGGEANP